MYKHLFSRPPCGNRCCLGFPTPFSEVRKAVRALPVAATARNRSGAPPDGFFERDAAWIAPRRILPVQSNQARGFRLRRPPAQLVRPGLPE